MQVLHGLGLVLCLGGCGSTAPAIDYVPDATVPPDASAEVATDVSPDAAQAGCAALPTAAICRLSGAYDLTYDQIAVESTPDPTGMSCRQITPLQRVTFTASADRLCAGVDELSVSPDGCTVQLTNRWHTDAASESWTNETKLTLTFAPQDGGALVGQGTARLSISGFHLCAKTATVTARAP
jgi:hypothetical protein